MIFNKLLIDFIFVNNLNLFYNILNNDYTFDYNYVNQLYKLNNTDIYDVFQKYKLNSYTPNHLYGRKTINKYFQDGSIEHVFERLYINIIMHLNGTFHYSNKIKNNKIVKQPKIVNKTNTTTTFSIIHAKTCDYCNSNQRDCIILYQPNYHIPFKLIKLMNKIVIYIRNSNDIINNINKTYCSKHIFLIKNPKLLKEFKTRTYNNTKIIINIKNPILTHIQKMFKLYNTIDTMDDIQNMFDKCLYKNIYKYNKWLLDSQKILGDDFFIKNARLYNEKSYYWWNILSTITPKNKKKLYNNKKKNIYINNDLYNNFKFNYTLSDQNKILITKSPYLKHFYKPKEILNLINPSK